MGGGWRCRWSTNRVPPAEKILETARRVLRLEAAAVAALEGRLGQPFVQAVEAVLNASRVIVSGVGKSGIIGRKIAATLTSASLERPMLPFWSPRAVSLRSYSVCLNAWAVLE